MKKGGALAIRINKDNKTATTTIGKHKKLKGLERKWTSREGRSSDSSESSAHKTRTKMKTMKFQ